ncbi:hypothetical protein CkaCkLH20_06222 [Colletotrichum karsti]|uniref:C2H2-type domain-containing protein n=1 Tax=Colletotrichum karsti TaxID=1095194 RepID=A0A9P6I5A1_9PEZI|nr:uncharacterized protein CkaCkLH20_06222 [Colletotrichum karsti]KAF9876279.1 hypothetical protein CkaCkLH20_06222 [Colletotrichum karsti]
MAFSITSLLQTESLDQTAQSRQLFEETYRQYARSFPAQAKDEPKMSFLRRVALHAVNFAADFVLEITDEKNLQSTGYTITDQFYGERRNGMGILENATKDRRQLREMRETMQDAQRITLSLAAPPPLPPVERGIPESARQIIPSASSSRSSVSGMGNGCFSATASQPSTAASHAFSTGRRSLSPNPPPYHHDGLSGNGNHSNDESQDDDSNDDDDDYMMTSPNDESKDTREWSYEALKHRGKGRYICPEWRTCTKGGNNGHGSPKIFKRNCMFRQHLQKHDKPHKCLLGGCPNKEGFARKDQLLRHQLNVKHEDNENKARAPYHMTRM